MIPGAGSTEPNNTPSFLLDGTRGDFLYGRAVESVGQCEDFLMSRTDQTLNKSRSGRELLSLVRESSSL